ncbi:MAG: 50S ribosomal protein L16 [Candidatus Yonathbacteria bacterium CG_4_10_14_3_um_filter_47_65]|uniref:Large ribosomal subunit protein uL16 n=2 Tax=Parcubacteria group TaxID=1794811 RepID=A0A2M8D9S1_9BACT|nr:MAG: 50S ribosomal protein L16 [Candidatus Nomurabacteria bacterium CG1_02_47_685]PIP03208.1 MAG: 50S ribosomal protein L16 [Candidatus Yonathbacteria bacterium CG23_combo_of_CG06-09_8_20_14_all_46_18]PIQ31906.1 MAG: 50S ribosomal protein L16 [Candidatus Yonathbacteria bacterium CG17_big_fil_post_rev_8_21_14_2_50_46_19]PIX56328.1 MAG: 50S ribosomal protein L16 [Candidatus Yonathbacteria bacterium CG_4_10_14_3_um_filter_47_65]PIY57476.1 MAG: 50S ribosomal protein L16 [Candidatus Yonathbacteri
MLFPKKVKFRKWQTGRSNPERMIRPDTRGISIAFGSFGLKAQGTARIRSNQIEAARKTIARNMQKTGKVWIRIFPDRPYTAKPAEVGMGKGKGDLQGYCVNIRPGRILFEVDGVDESVAKEALRKAGAKLPLKTKIVSRESA